MNNRFLSSVSLLCLVLAWTGMRGPTALAEGPDAPKIDTVDPVSPIVSSQEQRLKFTGTNLKDVTVKLADKDGKETAAKVELTDDTHLGVLAKVETVGTWKLSATSKDGKTSKPFEIKVVDTASGTTPKPDSSSVPIPKINEIVPGSPLIAPNQRLVLKGSDFKDGVTVRFTDASGNDYDAVVQTPIMEDRLVVVATFGIGGKWTVTAINKGEGKRSDALTFAVANAIGPRPEFGSPAFVAFGFSALVATILLFLTMKFVHKEISKAQASGWSLQEALSEESIFQPKVITQKSEVITYASTSRVIALIGLMGILCIVVGVGYAIIWNLTMFGVVPDLSQVRSYLLGAACLFAPYLANQLSGAITPSAKPQPGDSPATTAVTGVAPATPLAGPAPQALRITGNGFQPGLNMSLTDPQNAAHSVPVGDITEVVPTMITANVTLNTPGSWRVVVANPASSPMAPFGLSVLGPPTVNAVNPAVAPGPITFDAANPRKIILGGSGFVSGLTVQLTPPGGGAALSPKAEMITSQQVTVTALFSTQGQWQVVVTNPGNQPSAPYTFPIN